MQLKIIGMHGNVRIFELDDDFHGIALGACIEIEQRVLVEKQLSKDAFQAQTTGFGHKCIVNPLKNTSVSAREVVLTKVGASVRERPRPVDCRGVWRI